MQNILSILYFDEFIGKSFCILYFDESKEESILRLKIFLGKWAKMYFKYFHEISRFWCMPGSKNLKNLCAKSDFNAFDIDFYTKFLIFCAMRDHSPKNRLLDTH